MKSFGVAEPVREALRPVLPRIDLAFVFGSVAKATDHADSDIDLMVVRSVSNLDLLRALDGVNELLRRQVNCNLYSAREWTRLQADPVAFTDPASSCMSAPPRPTVFSVAMGVLARHGLRPGDGEGHRAIALQAVLAVLKMPPREVQRVIRLHDLRNSKIYRSPLPASDADASDAREALVLMLRKASAGD